MPLYTFVKLQFPTPEDNSATFAPYRSFTPRGASFVRGEDGPTSYIWIFRDQLADELRARDPILFTEDNLCLMSAEDFSRHRRSLPPGLPSRIHRCRNWI